MTHITVYGLFQADMSTSQEKMQLNIFKLGLLSRFWEKLKSEQIRFHECKNSATSDFPNNSYRNSVKDDAHYDVVQKTLWFKQTLLIMSMFFVFKIPLLQLRKNSFIMASPSINKTSECQIFQLNIQEISNIIHLIIRNN